MPPDAGRIGWDGMIKLNITLPSGGGIAIEADDRELVREVLYSAMPHLLGGSVTSAGDAVVPAGAGVAAAGGYGVDGGAGDGAGGGIGIGNGNEADGSVGLAGVPPAAGADASGVSVNGRNGHHDGGAANGQHSADAGVVGNGAAVPTGYAVPPAVSGAVPAQPYLPPSDLTPAPVAAPGISVPSPSASAMPAAGIVPAPSAVPGPAAGGVAASPSASSMPGPVAGVAPAPSIVPGDVGLPVGAAGTAAEQAFADYCQQVNPLGDMRKVVVAAEAAARYLDLQSVDPDRLAALFTLAGWPIPHSFVQTLRNAARSKFRWMERVAGLNGHYRVSDVGRSIVLGESGGG